MLVDMVSLLPPPTATPPTMPAAAPCPRTPGISTCRPRRPRDRLADRRRLGPGAEARFLRLVTSRRIDVVDLTPDNYVRCVELIEVYADLGFGFVDASVVAIAAAGIVQLATLNRRDFTVVRPCHVDAFHPFRSVLVAIRIAPSLAATGYGRRGSCSGLVATVELDVVSRRTWCPSLRGGWPWLVTGFASRGASRWLST